jgi:hypothetical protein
LDPSTGVGTVTMNMLQPRIASMSLAKERPRAAASTAGSTSRVRSWPAASSAMRPASMSKPTTGMWRASATASGSPT